MPEKLGPYELRAELSRGTSVVLWRAWDPEGGREIVLLEPRMPVGLDEASLAEYATEFKWESLGAAGLAHPGIVKVVTSDIVDGRPAQVLEPIEGNTLRRRLQGGPLDPSAALQITEALLEALAYAHGQGVMHGDINPDNVFIGESGQARLAGFGVPHVGEDPVLTRSGAVMGTPGYLAPEQVSEDPVDARADLFAVAALTHEMLTGRNPFGASEGLPVSTVMYRTVYHVPSEMPQAAVAGLPRDIRPALLVALAKEPKGRYQDAASFLAALRGEAPGAAAVTAGLVAAAAASAPAPSAQAPASPVTTSPPATSPAAEDAAAPAAAAASSPGGPGRRRRWMALAAAGGAAVICLAVVLTFTLGGGSGAGDATTLPQTTVAVSTTTTATTASPTSTTVDTLSTTTVSLTTTTVLGKEIAAVTLGDMTVTYSGQARAVSVITDPADLNVVVVYSQAGNQVTAPTDAGTYEVAATVDDEKYQGSAVGILTINKADPIINVSGWTGVYTGTSHGATGTARGVQGENLTSRLSTGAGFTNVPGGRANWTYTEGANYNGASGSVAITITKATLSVNAAAKSKTYGTADPALTYTFSGFRSGDGPTNSGITGTASMTRNAGESVAGSPYQIRVTGVGGLSAPNYSFAIGATAGLTVTKANASISVSGWSGEYDGNSHGATGSATGARGENLSGLLDLGASFSIPGKHTADWTFSGDANHFSASGSVTIEITEPPTTTTPSTEAGP